MMTLTLEAKVALGRGIALESDLTAGKDIDFLQLAIRRIYYFARLEKIKRMRSNLLLRINAPGFRISYAGKQMVCELPGTSADWKKESKMRSVVYNVIFNVLFNLPPGDAARGVPAWMTAAIDEAMDSSTKAEQIIHGNRDYYLPREMVRLYRKLPRFTAMMQTDPETLSGDMLKCYRQHARLLLEVFASRKTLAGTLRDYNSGKAVDFWVKWFTSDSEAQYVLEQEALKLMWNYHYPEPTELLLKKFDSLKTIPIPELDPQNSPTGKMLHMNYQEAAALLAGKRRPDSLDIRREFARRCREFGNRASINCRNICYRLAKNAMLFGSEESAAENYAIDLAKLKIQLEMDLRIRDFVNQAARKHLPAWEFYHSRMESANAENDAMTPETRKFLLDIEKLYLTEY